MPSSLLQVLQLLVISVVAVNAAPPLFTPQQENVPQVSDQDSQPRVLCQPTPRQRDGLSQQQQQQQQQPQQPQLQSGCFLPVLPPSEIDRQQQQETTSGSSSASGTASLSTSSERVTANTATSSPANTTAATGDLTLPSAATTGSENQSGGNPPHSKVSNDGLGTAQFGTPGDNEPASAIPSNFGGQITDSEQNGSSKNCVPRGQRCTFGLGCCSGLSCVRASNRNEFYSCN